MLCGRFHARSLLLKQPKPNRGPRLQILPYSSPRLPMAKNQSRHVKRSRKNSRPARKTARLQASTRLRMTMTSSRRPRRRERSAPFPLASSTLKASCALTRPSRDTQGREEARASVRDSVKARGREGKVEHQPRRNPGGVVRRSLGAQGLQNSSPGARCSRGSPQRVSSTTRRLPSQALT